jgi:fructokinase
LHFGSISLIDELSRSATLHAVEIAREAGALISYDPNLRLNLWPNADAAREGIRLGWALAHVVKASQEEIEFLGGDLARLLHPDVRLLVVTHGARGCRYVTRAFSGDVPGFPVEVVDTTGAGDGFVAGLLKGLLAQPGAFEDESRLREICRYANAVGALTTTQRGAIPALPMAQRVGEFLERRRMTNDE